MKSVGLQKWGVVIAFLVQFAAIAFWGGGMNQKVDNLQDQFAGYVDRVQVINDRQTNRIRSLEGRIVRLEERMVVLEERMSVVADKCAGIKAESLYTTSRFPRDVDY